MNEVVLKVLEKDEAGNINATYVQSRSNDKGQSTRIDVLDSLQAFTSSIAHLLSSRAVLQGIGVGDATASTTGAILLTVLQESMGRVATIAFAHKLGTSLEPECKMYRLAADVFNDAAIVLDCVSPALPKLARVGVLSLASVLRALCGVAAGSSKASLSAHFAKWGNLGELNAKDSSQETIISLMGMLAGSVVVSYVSSPMAVWSWLVLLLSIHLATNRAAVQAVSMHTLNRQRANIVLSHLVEDDVVLRPKDVSKSERIFEWDGVLRWKASAVLGSARIGVQLREVIASTAGYDSRPGSIHPRPGARVDMDELARVYHQEQYLLWCDQTRNRVLIVLKEGATPVSQLKAWMQALLTVRYFTQRARAALGREPKVPDDDNDAGAAAIVGILRDQLRAVDKDFDGFVARLREAGWDVDAAALETRSGWRVCISPGPS